MGGTGRARPDPPGPVGEVPEDLVEGWEQHRDRMLRAARGYAGQATTAEDIVQEDGRVLSNRVVEGPFGLIATASRAQVLAALWEFSTSEIVMYSWRWRLRAPA